MFLLSVQKCGNQHNTLKIIFLPLSDNFGLVWNIQILEARWLTFQHNITFYEQTLQKISMNSLLRLIMKNKTNWLLVRKQRLSNFYNPHVSS